MSFATSGLSVRYRPGRPRALREVSMEVAEGSLYAVLGPNGSGKSTLLRALLGTVSPEEGEARVEGRPIQEWTRKDLARTVGVVSQQESIAFPLTVRELVAMGRYPHLGPLKTEGEADRRAIRNALERCDASELSNRTVDTLSGGEFQRIRIARALAQEPRALALDEPTSSLDLRHAMGIMRLLRESVRRGMTVLLVTHDLNLAARFAHRILLLDEGRVAAEGTVEEVLTEEILREVYGWPVRVVRDRESGSSVVIPLDQARHDGR